MCTNKPAAIAKVMLLVLSSFEPAFCFEYTPFHLVRQQECQLSKLQWVVPQGSQRILLPLLQLNQDFYCLLLLNQLA
jgi:hypothetical protein